NTAGPSRPTAAARAAGRRISRERSGVPASAGQTDRAFLEQPGLLGLGAQVPVRARADLLDDEAGRQRAEVAAFLQAAAGRVAEQEACRVEVAGAGRVDQLVDLDRLDLDRLVAAHDDRA